ncbi:pyrroline-5-carboxylate reductase [Paenibacillus campi]|uniref:pyrroline-5-carboxylate reductase n=1 Tax=Paenibacillus campi TaxID=3106031 RepID=UPI002AFE2B54|nr:pyrroline-5-carboxylate reductase [Paenibacillus sp. SGZ-1009]
MSHSSTQHALIEQSICFYGAGSMAEAILRGLVNRSVVVPGQVTMLNRSNQDRLQYLIQRYGVTVVNDETKRNEALQQAGIIVLAMKPIDAAAALRQLSPLLKPDQLLVSVIAGLEIRTIQELLGKPQPIARTMPNTSSTIGLGATGIVYADEVSHEQRTTVRRLFEAVGTVTEIAEHQMETLTGISGSGPAYIYYMMEAMIAAGVQGGLSLAQARELTIQTAIGAAHMVQQTGEEPAELRAKVTSPNGSTAAAIKLFDEHEMKQTIMHGIERCAERSREMGAALKEELS